MYSESKVLKYIQIVATIHFRVLHVKISYPNFTLNTFFCLIYVLLIDSLKKYFCIQLNLAVNCPPWSMPSKVQMILLKIPLINILDWTNLLFQASASHAGVKIMSKRCVLCESSGVVQFYWFKVLYLLVPGSYDY